MLLTKIKQISSGQLIKNIGWLGTAELANRIFRLGTTVTLARIFSTQDYGLMAVIYTVTEFSQVLTMRGGIGGKIIQADEHDLKTICNTSYWLNWMVCITIFITQCLLAFPVAHFYEQEQLVAPICVMGIAYLILPNFLINTALIERENRLNITAICNAVQSFLSNLITIILAILGMGVWSIVWAFVLPNLALIIIARKNNSWRPTKRISLHQWQSIINFGKNILGVELLNKLRFNLDYLIIGKFLSIQELGLYYFAFNAGSGITSNVIYSSMSALYPHICAVRHNLTEMKNRYFSSLKIIGVIIVSIVILQSSLAQFYVPIIFGEKWTKAIPILIIICISVIPLAFRWSYANLLKAADKTHIMLYFDIIYTFIFGISILTAVQWGIFWVAVTVLIIHTIMSSIFSIWATKSVFK